MFEGSAEEAMNFYIGLFPNSEVLELQRYEDGDNAGKLVQASFTLDGREFICIDSPMKHDFSFTPAISIFVDCESLSEFERVFAAFEEGGKALMPLDNYGFSEKFGRAQDRFGAPSQLNLP